MRAERIIQQQFERELQDVHLARLRVVFTAVRALLRSGRLSLTNLGRAIAGATTPKHGIKRADRLLGNRRLHEERVLFFRAVAQRLVGRTARPIIHVDWTAFTPRLWALMAAVSFEGRALVVYAETHPISSYMKPRVNVAFLRRLRDVLPASCHPILVADAGFRAPWMKLVSKMGWDYVVRVRSPVKIRRKYGRGWVLVRVLFALTRSVVTDFGRVEIGCRGRHVCRLVGIRKRGRHAPPKTISHWNREGRVRKHRRMALEPWILGTSLDLEPARIVAIYAKRMQIEETFRDAKSPRFGISLGYARTTSVDRANVLLLLAALAHVVAVLVGIAAERAELHLRQQANTIRNRRVLSLPTLGRLVAATADAAFLSGALSTRAWRLLGERVTAAATV